MNTRSPRRLLATTIAIAIALALHAPTRAQTFPDPAEFPRGIVLDERSQPLAGARIWLAIDADPQNTWARAVAQRLARAPLPATQSQRDGTFVLPVLPELRPLGTALTEFNSPRGPMLWLIVEHDGFLPWREPLQQGLGGYLGSRVLLRRRVADDPFADVPWPPALAEMDYPWIGIGAPHPATRATQQGPQVDPASKVATTTVTLRVVDGNGKPVSRAELLFDERAYAEGGELPMQTDAEGRATVRLPAGECLVRIFAAQCSSSAVPLEIPERTREVTLQAQPGEWVDLITLGRDARPVPFVEVPIVALHIGPAGGMPPFRARSDSEGRIRCNVVQRDAYIAYSDEAGPGGGSLAVPLDAEGEQRRTDGVVLVPMFRPVTLIVRADRLRTSGELRRVTDRGQETLQGFDDAATDPLVVTRLLTREHAEVWVSQRGVAPLVLRAEDLPPPGPEPLLALAVLDRTLKKRADLVVTSADGRAIRRLWIGPSGQSRLTSSRFERGREPGLELWARDDHAYDLCVEAIGHAASPLALAAQGTGDVPKLSVRLEPNE